MNNILSAEEQVYFKKWIELNLSGISWEGRYLAEFNQFWEEVFKPGISISEQFSVLKKLATTLNEGPLISWINWLQEKMICFSFVYKGQSLESIAKAANMDVGSIATICRDFFIERYPQLEESINAKFQIGNKLSKNLALTFPVLRAELQLPDSMRGALENEIMTSLEITLYSEWGKLKEIIESPKTAQLKNIKTKKSPEKKSQKFRFFSELLMLFVVGALLIFGIKLGNTIYENYLVKNISLFEPNFLNLETSLSFKTESNIEKDDISISMDELEALEKIESKQVFEDTKSVNRYEVESDVVLTSVDSLPKDFSIADLEQSTYEEIKKGGYRNRRYGRKKAYRVMMTSVDANKTKIELSNLFKDYDVKQVDNVKLGTSIPGGIYFNLYIPRLSLKDFLSKVSSLEQATILESRTSKGGPDDTNKVFIWVKSI